MESELDSSELELENKSKSKKKKNCLKIFQKAQNWTLTETKLQVQINPNPINICDSNNDYKSNSCHFTEQNNSWFSSLWYRGFPVLKMTRLTTIINNNSRLCLLDFPSIFDINSWIAQCIHGLQFQVDLTEQIRQDENCKNMSIDIDHKVKMLTLNKVE